MVTGKSSVSRVKRGTVQPRQRPTELHDLAAEQLDRLDAMVEKWTRIARDVLHAQPAVTLHDQSPASNSNREWTNFDSEKPTGLTEQKQTRRWQANACKKKTKLTIQDGILNLLFSGEDPGIAFDLRSHSLPSGPYSLSFQLKRTTDADFNADKDGDLFFTTDRQTTLPKGTRIPFTARDSQEWQEVSIPIKTDKSIQQLRLDVCDGPGKATIRQLRLSDSSGKTLLQWPK